MGSETEKKYVIDIPKPTREERESFNYFKKSNVNHDGTYGRRFLENLFSSSCSIWEFSEGFKLYSKKKTENTVLKDVVHHVLGGDKGADILTEDMIVKIKHLLNEGIDVDLNTKGVAESIASQLYHGNNSSAKLECFKQFVEMGLISKETEQKIFDDILPTVDDSYMTYFVMERKNKISESYLYEQALSVKSYLSRDRYDYSYSSRYDDDRYRTRHRLNKTHNDDVFKFVVKNIDELLVDGTLVITSKSFHGLMLYALEKDENFLRSLMNDISSAYRLEFSPHTLTKMYNDQLRSPVVSFDDFVNSYATNKVDFAPMMADKAIKSKDMVKFRYWLETGSLNVYSNNGGFIVSAFSTRDDDTIKTLYDEFGLQLSDGAYKNLPMADFFKSAAIANSQEFLEDITKCENADEVLYSALTSYLQLKSINMPYFKQAYEKLSDVTHEMKEELFFHAVQKKNSSLMDFFVEDGLDLKNLSKKTLAQIVNSCEKETVIKLRVQGLEFGEHINGLIARFNHSAEKMLQEFRNEELAESFPRWELQDDNTVALLTVVRSLSESEIVVLRRSFNFSVGMVDHMYETRNIDNGDVKIQGANSIEMGQLSQAGIVQKAADKLQDLGGRPDMTPSKPAKPKDVLQFKGKR